ncbi:MAG TPA: basic secretory protein-like protein [Verrucomicrobiales bacterium]|nr:basic secretory protein-like protein [Verrucomicrobiales bacterium]
MWARVEPGSRGVRSGYCRRFLYEPETRGAEITRRNLERARYDASYRVSANFLDWTARTYDADLVRKLNAAAREGQFEEGIWETLTGKPVEELAGEWKKALEDRLDAESSG